jgi:hypothetical protein
MLAVRIVLVLVLVVCGRDAQAQCTPAEIATAEANLQSVETDIADIDSSMSLREAELDAITAQIEPVREEARSNPLKRRRLESLLGESRAKARELEALSADRSALQARRTSIAGQLRTCYGDSLSASLGRLVESIRRRQFDLAREQLVAVQKLEDRIARLGPGGTTAEDYPVISDEFIERSLDSAADRLFLIDTIEDLLDKALADSAAAAVRLSELEESIQLKKDLLRLVTEARQGGLDRGAFFESFGRDDVGRDIKELEAEAAGVESALAEAVRAIAYYRDHRVRLTTDPDSGQE